MGSLDTLAAARRSRLLVLTAGSMVLSLSLACSAQSPADASGEASDVRATAEPTSAAQTAAAAEATPTPQSPSSAQGRKDETAVAATGAGAGELPYDIECDAQGDCLVDKATYVGWRTYHAACHVCHAQDAVGSSFAPSLVTRLQEIDKARFYESVGNGYTGQLGVMPAWGADPNVNTKFDELYAYLKARSDGILAAGRPTRKR